MVMDMRAVKGKLIAIEGIDGAGKTAIARHIYGFLTNRGYRCSLLKEPSDSVYGKIIRNLNVPIDPKIEFMLFLKDREIDVKDRILPALRKGLIVIMDRYYYSNIAYQSARGLNADWIKKLNEKIAPKPDLVILLDLSAEKAMERIKRRKERSVFEELEFLKRVREKFLEIADEKTVIVNTERELNAVKKEVEQIVLLFAKKTFRDVIKQKNKTTVDCYGGRSL
jgi:dTMP kinase